MKNAKKITLVGMFCAISYVVMVCGRIPIVLFLSYDPKDAIIAIGGFILGPLYAFVIATVVSCVEMMSVSDTGIIGCVMNIISSCSFACTASIIYKKKRGGSGAVIGLISGVFVMVSVMLLWNYFITPIYMGYPREAVKALLLPAFLPFNAIKGGLNGTLTFLLYKPIFKALKKANLFEKSVNIVESDKRNKMGYILLGVFVLVTCIYGGLILKGIL
ncbi:ECF transporter S component [Blautia caecimuris]|uniref:ECF transporter S component n=1 Tax=Blautia caecimuris TaxID=1796615 RepID=UPI0034AC72F2